MNRLFLLFLMPVVSFAQNTTDTTIIFTLKTAKNNSFSKSISVNAYSQLYLHQSGIGSRERWESETTNSVLGVNVKIKLFEK